jgi:hypothetical protein
MLPSVHTFKSPARLLLIAALPLLASASSADSAVRAHRVAGDVWRVQGEAALGSLANRNFISNAAWFVTRDDVVAIDALGFPALADELLAEIDERSALVAGDLVFRGRVPFVGQATRKVSVRRRCACVGSTHPSGAHRPVLIC